MGRLTNEQRIINQVIGKPTEQKFTPIATDMFLPNHSGDHSAGIVNSVPTEANDIVNKAYVDNNFLQAEDDGNYITLYFGIIPILRMRKSDNQIQVQMGIDTDETF